ncbi:MAG TPA: hypothetical protein VN328_06595, partial [Thermodesulfovibrionales bacterium]|nr:hypothetical protein [Thermodesulfovibrionales bacterium]
MCGIFGLVVRRDAGYDRAFIKKSIRILTHLSESRGKDSSGLVIRNESTREFHVFKGAVYLQELLRDKSVVERLDGVLDATSQGEAGRERNTFAVMGHSRLVTNGSQLSERNNQPVVKDGVIGIHNGIIVNHENLWSNHSDIQRNYEIDTEVMLALIRKHVRAGMDIATAISKTIKEIFGTVAAAFLVEDLDMLAVATNNGSLYVLTDERDLFAFASEEYFLKRMTDKLNLDAKDNLWIRQVAAGKGFVVDLEQFRLQEFSFTGEERKSIEQVKQRLPYQIEVHSVSGGRPQRELVLDPSKIAAHPKALPEAALLQYNIERIQALRRCTRCILPETFPYVEFDEKGVCNYCNNYTVKNKPKPIEQLFDLVKPYRRSDGGYECVVPYSGGRDSTFTLHTVKKVLKLNPVAFTYDWGMVNDLARRNVARVCGKLGVENILVSADIAWKRENIRRNILAWLKKPHLGMVPLFMAGDKFFYYYTDQVKKQTGVRLNIWGVNPLENTEFKVGFLSVPPDHNKKWIYSLSGKRQMKLFLRMGKIVMENPGYLNRSVWNTLGGFVSRSVVPHRDYYHLFDYYRWDESEVEKLVREEYEWETAIDTPTTWRIGDGTAPFYNYI